MSRRIAFYKLLGGGYTGSMHTEPLLFPRGQRIRSAPTLSRDARHRLRWIEFYLARGRRVFLTCRLLGISTATFYCWWRRYDPRRLESLEDDRSTGRRLYLAHRNSCN